ncbi:CP2 transcription factor [Penicillium sp. IBT 18751x]|nr:CP2 transcription factor [Penicillium sp. IBT 18751x]
MPQIVPEVVNRGTLGRGKSHDPGLVAERVAWPPQASGSSFACLDPGALSLQFGFDEPQMAPPSDFSEKDKIFHHQTGEFELVDPYQISNSSPFAQPDSSEDLSMSLSTKVDCAVIDDSLERSSGEQFRYNVSLLAPTAMFNAAKEDPVTYLNKSQIYSLIIKDIHPPPVGSGPVRYRTYIRVSFDDKEQRSRPAAYWQLWNDGRAKCEAPRHGGKLHAVEYANAPRSHIMNPDQTQARLETASFDGFCVTWSGYPDTGYVECALGVRFNFLSTDFSHSKGVKGASVRLCVKTEMIQPDDGTFEHQPEICFCKVKLFRDHGAERKLANDAAHVNKTIEKLKKQVFEAGASDGSNSEKSKHFPMKIAKRYRKSRRGSSEKRITGGLQAEIDALQRMFSSVRRVSKLDLRGDEYDDPDLHPVQLGADSSSSPNDEHSPKTVAVAGHLQRNDSMASALAGMQLAQCDDLKGSVSMDTARRASEGNLPAVARITKAVDIDAGYSPPENAPRSVACFYVRFTRNGQDVSDYYHALYLTERTVRDLVDKISMKQQIDPLSVVRVLHMKRNGLRIMVDDEVVRELPEGQDMIVELSEVSSDASDGGVELAGTEVKLIF